MPNWKVTMLMQQGTGIASGDPAATQEHIGGWSESVYSNASDFNTLKDMITQSLPDGGVGLAARRATLLANSGTLLGFRIAQVLPKSGRSQTQSLNFNGVSGTTDIPQMSLQCNAGAVSALNVRPFNMRGVPDQYAVEGEFVPDALYRARLTTYFSGLGFFGFIGQDLTVPLYDIISITASSGVVAITAPALTLAVGNTVQISKTRFNVTGQSASFKAKIVNFADTTHFTIDPAPFLDCSGGTVRKSSPIFLQMDSTRIQVSRLATRKVGRPFGQYRGRASKRRRVA